MFKTTFVYQKFENNNRKLEPFYPFIITKVETDNHYKPTVQTDK